MADPLFWLGLSTLLVAVSLTAVLVAALPAFQELARAAHSAEKLFDTLNRDLPPTLEAIRLTGIELTHLTDDVGQNVQAAGRVVGQLDQGITGVRQQARQVQIATQSAAAGLRAAWQALQQSSTTARVIGATRPAQPMEDSEDDDSFEASPEVDTAQLTSATPLVEDSAQRNAALPTSAAETFRSETSQPTSACPDPARSET